MPRTIPPFGKSTSIDENSQVPHYRPEDFPIIALWRIEYTDGVRTHGMSLVHSQSALNRLHRLLQQEYLTFKALTGFKVMPCDNLSVEPCPVRVCDVLDHNRRGKPQDNFCYECGRPTRLVRIVENE